MLTAFPDMPLDVLDSVEVIKEEHICVPAYLFYCNAMCQFTYDAGNERQHKNIIIYDNRNQVFKYYFFNLVRTVFSLAIFLLITKDSFNW